MKYFFDTEFKEYHKKPRFGKAIPTIDLISIGIVCEDGREFYALNKECDLKEVWKDQWLQDNVLLPIYREYIHGDIRNIYDFTYKTMCWLFKRHGKSKPELCFQIFRFVHQLTIEEWDDKFSFAEDIVETAYKNGEQTHEFYAYYADYDWVVLCQLFGRMLDLPKGFPMYCKDLKQQLDEAVRNKITLHCKFTTTVNGIKKQTQLDADKVNKHDINEALELIKLDDNYPKQENEHNALDDAKWNLALYNFIKNISV